MKKKKRKKSKLILFFIFIVYIAFFLRWVYDRGVPTDILRYGNIDYTVKAQGVILRDEICYSLDINGKYIPSLTEGAKVSKDAEIAVAMKEEVLSLFDQRQDKAKELYKVRSEVIADKEGLQILAVSGINAGMKQQLQDLMELSSKNITLGTADIVKNLQNLITEQFNGASVPVSVTPQEKVLQDQIDVLDAAIARNKLSVCADKSGIVSYTIDHAEQYLKIDDYSAISLKQLDALRQQYRKQMNQQPYTVNKNEPFVKIITDFRYRILTEADEESINRLKNASRIQIKILNKGIVANAYVIYSGADSDGRNFIVFALDEKPEVLSEERFLNIEIVSDAYSGYKVPITSLLDIRDGKAKIIIVENSFAAFKEVDIVAMNGDYAIIKSTDIQLYDIFVLDPRNIKEGQVLS